MSSSRPCNRGKWSFTCSGKKVPNGSTTTMRPSCVCSLSFNCRPGVQLQLPPLGLWQGNMDIQIVTNAYAAILYIASYVSKAEKVCHP